MHPHLILLAFLAPSIYALDKKLKGISANPGNSLVARQIQFCDNGGDSCAECYGVGNIQCGSTTCYDPTIGESCCDDGRKFSV